MSKTKQWAWDTAEKVSDDIINSYVKGDIDFNNAKLAEDLHFIQFAAGAVAGPMDSFV